ncbi:DEAD/DEAH box helicase [Pelagicoccus sp. SDUM812005]|uniref:DEAD/DEAH box helicase n=1 Tax=Pelagicoccus sp. SDUM812005 TaxID=3041257 RepID=UPI00280EC5FC|nr:DEAD/DEAH box helicase [Pelagicoccus sp. SDUM812005]MDQ8180472.1 DEAD/DEAH box helicase [Pelagicoccus sp. SDUM812005]
MERLVYVLTPQGRQLECSLRLTRLMKWDAFSETDLSNLKVLFSKKYEPILTPADRSIVMGLMQLIKREGQWPILDGQYGFELLKKMLELKSVFFAFGAHRPLVWSDPLEGTLGWTPTLGREGEWETTAATPPGTRAFPLNPPIYIQGDECRCGPLATTQPPALSMRWLAARSMKAADVSGFCLRLAKEFPNATFPTPEFARLEESQDVKPVAVLTIQQRALTEKRERDEAWIELRDRLRLRLRFRYGKALVAWDASESAVSYREDGAIKRVPRDRDFEEQTQQALKTWGFEPSQQAGNLDLFNFDSSTFSISSGFSWRSFLEETIPELDAQWEVEYAKGLTIALAQDSDLLAEVESDGAGGFALSLDLKTKGRREALLPVLHRTLRRQSDRGLPQLLAWLREESFALRVFGDQPEATHLVVLPSSTLATFADQLYELYDRNPFDTSARARVSQWRLGELAAAGLVDASALEGISKVLALCERIGAGIDVRERKTPQNLALKLRDYQRMGLGWLTALDEVAAGGILADDMGLGKTAQTIAHLLDLKQRGRLANGALIVAPTSVVDNWIDELERFAPTLKVARFHGKDRDRAWQGVGSCDVTLTSFALLRLESERLQSRPWTLAILDEAQNIKNAASQTAATARGLRAERKLCLTGTPIENRLEDIWSLFEFLLPGFLGDENTFRSRIVQTLKDAGDSSFAEEVRNRLKRRLSPFVLRRTKREVLKDLPERTEVVHAVSMTPAQRDFYDTYRKEARAEIGTSLAVGGIAGARMLILARLLRLRQICCDPRLLEEGASHCDSGDSAKLEALLELVEELIGQGSRILIFSQFTSMLELIADALDDARIERLILTGSTKDRASVVQSFQEGQAPVFLISLRAGGAGLNLTAADCVIHFDPWWNPAVERQASDRIYRIGQQKRVFVYKLIVDDSIESKIQHLQKAKTELVEELLTEGNVERLEIDQDTIDYLLDD